MSEPHERECHIYAQESPGEVSTILGNRAALEQLRELIDMALESDTAGAEFIARDGDHYHVHVICSDNPEVWRRAGRPYTDWIDVHEHD